MPRSLPVFLLPCLVLSACGGEKSSEEARSTVEVPLDLGAASPSGGAQAVPASSPKQDPSVAVPAAAVKSSGAVLALDAWHRRGADARRVPSGEQAAELSELHQALGGGAAMIQTRWAQRAPSGLGAEATRLATAFAREGTQGLERTLSPQTSTDPAQLAFREVLVVRALELQEIERAGSALGHLLNGAVAAGYPRERILEWAPLAATVAEGVGKVLPSSEYVVASGDSYWKICNNLRKKGTPINHGWVKLFNRKRGDNITAGEKLRIPSLPLRVECWRQLRLTAVFAGALPVRIYATSSGKPESPTPLGEFTLQICEKEPIYYPPGAPSVPYKNPENPLGERWLGFAEDRQYGLHGTNSESTIGSFETGGCIRMHNVDVIELFDLAGPGTKVRLNP